MRVNVVSLVGGILGFVSLPLPWLTVTMSGFGFSQSISVSGVQLMASIGSIASGGTPTSQGLESAAFLVTLGLVLVLVGAIVSLLHPAGGIILIGGAVSGVSGTLLLSAAPSMVGIGFTVGPGVGLFLALIGGIVATCGFALPKRFMEPAARAPFVYMAMPPPLYANYSNPAYGLPAAPPPDAPEPLPHPRSVALDPPPPTAPPTPRPVEDQGSRVAAEAVANLSCPVCGQRSNEPFCTRDGTIMRAG